MDSAALISAISWILTGLICIGLAIPLRLGRIRRNAFYGVRFPQSYKSDEAWFAINRYGGMQLIFWSVPMMLAGVIELCLPLKTHPRWNMWFGLGPMIFLFIAVYQSWRFARRF
jgi:uncharacterized membrane protein